MIQKFTLAVLGLVTVYVVIAMINAVFVSAATRRTEFAIARLTGLSRRQVVGMALWESLTVVTVGVMVGAFAAGGTIVGVTAAASEIVGIGVVAPPWALFSAIRLPPRGTAYITAPNPAAWAGEWRFEYPDH